MQKEIEFIESLLRVITLTNGQAATENFYDLRAVDAKVREAKIFFGTHKDKFQSILGEMENDIDFKANSRRVRLEALANYCRTAQRFLESGTLISKNKIEGLPDIMNLTTMMPGLDLSIKRRWQEAQKCLHSECYLSSVIMMGSILEALLLARANMSPEPAYGALSAPKDKKTGKSIAIHDWNLNTLINVSVECSWLKADRGKFSHALRESRNVVHPWAEVSQKADFDGSTCKTSWEILKGSIDDLLKSL